MKHTLATSLAILTLAAGTLRAEEEKSLTSAENPELTGVFFDVTDVNVVNVEVFVTDKKGRRITGLKPEDFEVYENGQRMEIANFFAVADGKPVAVPGAPGTAAAEPRRERRLEPIELPEEQRLHLIVYIDNYNIRPANRNRVLNRLRRFLYEKIDPDDRVMVVSYDRSLHIRQPFTSDMLLVTEALDELAGLSGIAVTRDKDRRLALDQIETSPNDFEALQWARSFAEQVFTEMNFTLDAIDAQISALSGLVGRKALLYVSDGIPLVPGEDVFIAVEERFRESTARVDAYAYTYATRYRELVNKANAGGTTFYTLDAGGLQAHESISAEFGGARQGGGQSYLDAVRKGNLQAPLSILADDTGGRAILNTNAVEAGLAKIAEDFDNYYSLGYHAPHSGDGRFYKIDVKVKRKGLQVRHRNGYRDKTPQARLSDGSIATVYFGFERNLLGAEVELGKPNRQDGGHYLMPMTVKIPLGKLALAPRQDVEYLGRFKVSVVVLDDEGRVSPVQQQEPVTVTIPASDVETALKQHFVYEMQLVLRKGVSRIAVGVHDELAAETSFLRKTVDIATRAL